MGQQFGSAEILKIFVISDHIYRSTAAFKILMPVFKGFKDGQEFLVVGVIVEFCRV